MPIAYRRDVWQRKNEREAGADVSLIDTLGLWVTYILGCPVPSYLLCSNKVHMCGFLMPFKSNKNQKGAESNIRCCSGCVRKDSPHPAIRSNEIGWGMLQRCLAGGCLSIWGAGSRKPPGGRGKQMDEAQTEDRVMLARSLPTGIPSPFS